MKTHLSKIIFQCVVSIVLIFFSDKTHSQSKTNGFGFSYISQQFLDWEVGKNKCEIYGEYSLTPELRISVAYSRFEDNLVDYFSVVDIRNYIGKISARDVSFADASANISLLTDTFINAQLSFFLGPTLKWGEEYLLDTVVFDNGVQTPGHYLYNNWLGMNTGIEFSLIIIKHIQLKYQIKFRAFNKGYPDLNYGASLGYCFSYPRKKASREIL